MEIKKIKIGEKVVMPFTIPSGIVTTQVSSLEKLAREVPELGILTTKSIGPEPRFGNKEPILATYAPNCFMNAVGLTNPGVENFAKELSKSNFPNDKFLLASIFGKDVDEFVYVAKTLEDQIDGFELNLSCPHAKGYGMQLGQDPEMVSKITRAITSITKKPVFAKLTPNAGNIQEIAKSAVEAGAYGITAINTVGPGYHSLEGNPVLTNQLGGMSGQGILPVGLKCVRQIREGIGDKIPIIGMGGIRTARDIIEYRNSGADIFGVGSGLAAMTDENIKLYFEAAVADIKNNGESKLSSQLLRDVDMSYRRVEITKKTDHANDFKVFRTNANYVCKPGQFVFAWVPGVGEKPFSIMDNEPFTLGIQEAGEFTRRFNQLEEGSSFYIRGPYGQEAPIDFEDDRIVLVGGGCGIAGITSLAKRLKEISPTILLGARDKDHIPYLDQLKQWGNVYIATEDGSAGVKGYVTDLFKEAEPAPSSQFFNCGPSAMIEAVTRLERSLSKPEHIFSSHDYITSCGVGLCGKCADPSGRRSCIEGPYLNS
jgi:dihydroorotate dehydrogenase subfamily 1